VSEPQAAMLESMRLITFEVGGACYGLPIGDVLEVAEIGRICCVPTLPPTLGGVMNHHGDALPVVRPATLFEIDGADLPEPEHALVLVRGPDESAGRLAVPVDRVIGLVDTRPPPAEASGFLIERQPIDGRLVNILDTACLFERAAGVIAGSVGNPDSNRGGER
jgi:chemotaxis signal transduction protein